VTRALKGLVIIEGLGMEYDGEDTAYVRKLDGAQMDQMFSDQETTDDEIDLRRAQERAIVGVFDGEPHRAAYWFLTCAAICIRREGREPIVADVVEAMQRFMNDDSSLALENDRAVLSTIVAYYDSIAPNR
jgi:hypothetical protein